MKSIVDHVKPNATFVASNANRELFPLPVNLEWLRVSAWPPGGFSRSQCEGAWVELVAVALNLLHGCAGPFPTHRRGRAVNKSLDILRDRVKRFLDQPSDPGMSIEDVWNDIKNKRISYSGEEVALAQPLSLEQIKQSMPPVGHGGSVDLAPLLVGRSRFLVEHPEHVLIPEDRRPKGSNSAKVHLVNGEEIKIFQLMRERGIITFISENEVFADEGGKYLSGLFGVPKPNKLTPSNLPVLRVIMNLIPINKALEVILGDIGELPGASAWQQLVLSETDCITISQADMASAFDLFKLPRSWCRYLCFNFKLKRSEVNLGGDGYVYPACTVLPMGWASSVGLMQMASRELMLRAKMPPQNELRKQSQVPRWFCEMVKDIPTHETWWQVYLDNFMSAEVSRNCEPSKADEAFHARAVESWDKHHVLCSPEKHVWGTTVGVELGVQIHGPNGLVGASATRIFKAVLAALKLIKQKRGKIKDCQVVLGRWTFILQFRRAAMCVLSRSWDYMKPNGANWANWNILCAEISQLILLTPLLQFDLRSQMSSLVTCSDASESGGAVASSSCLTKSGLDLCNRLSCSELDPLEGSILVISVFNGIGGCFRAYDLIGLRPAGLVSIEIDKAAQRVVKLTWPHALEVSDVNLVDLDMIRHWANLFPRVTHVQLWGGFPCVHLNLEGPGSNLFFKLVEIIEMAQQVFGSWCTVDFIIENVFSMDVTAREEISSRLTIKPFKLDPADCCPMSRPRLAWVSFPVTASEGVELLDFETYVEVKMIAKFPSADAWITPGWKQNDPTVIFPTFMKSIPRARPPPFPAGLGRCGPATVERWTSDSFRFPPYQHADKYLLYNNEGDLRYLNIPERELLMGMGFSCTQFCFSASAAKSHKTDFQDKRYSLLGDGFAMISFAWLAGHMCQHFLPSPLPQDIIDRYGLAPGAAVAPGVSVPLDPSLQYGGVHKIQSNAALVGHVSRHVAQNGSDVCIALGVPYSPKHAHHTSLRAPWWDWKIVFTTKWDFHSHINSLEMRMILQALQWRSRNPDNFSTRWLRLADSMVCNYILSKGRTSSKLLQPLVRKINSLQLAMNGAQLHGHVDSAANPTDAPSRASAGAGRAYQ